MSMDRSRGFLLRPLYAHKSDDNLPDHLHECEVHKAAYRLLVRIFVSVLRRSIEARPDIEQA